MNNTSGTWWLKRILAADSLVGLRASLTLIVHRIGFRYFVFRGRYAHLRSGQHEIRLDNCPAAWIEHCSEAKPDPVHCRAMEEAVPVFWRECVFDHPDFFAAARRFGLMTGVTHPVHGPSGDRSSIGFIKGVGGVQAEREILAALSECQLISCYVHRSVAHILKLRFDRADPLVQPASPEPTLTKRERECLTWTATGKTAAEAAAALDLSESTIVYHLSKARRKLDAANSRQAISKAISLRLIAPD